MTTSQQIFETIVELEKSGTPAVLVTVVRTVGSTPRKAGAKMLVLQNRQIIGTVGGAMLESLAIDVAMEVLKSGTPCTQTYNLNDIKRRETKMICGGSAGLFFEPIATHPWLYMFGAGHCGNAIADVAHRAGFHCVIIDERSGLTPVERFPYADEIHCNHPPEVARTIKYHAPAYVVIATHCHDMDLAVARAVLQRGMPHYLGIIGSRKKRIEMMNALEDIIDETQFEKIHMPIGLDIGAETPEEIAVSVVAELIRVRRGTKGLYEAEASSLKANQN